MNVVQKNIDELIPYINNSRTHSSGQINKIAASIKEFGFMNPIILDGDSGVIAGHGRLMAAKKLNLDDVPCLEASHLTEAQKKAYIIADNAIALDSDWDIDLLKVEIEGLDELDFDLDILGLDDDELSELLDLEVKDKKDFESIVLSDKYGMQPFTVFNARDGSWQDRKRYWIEKGIDSQSGRGENLSGSCKVKKGTKTGYTNMSVPTSIFDPVLCEIGYKWFSPDNGLIIDPFAGGSVRGIMASLLNREYIGNDLSERQISENRKQADKICHDIIPVWTVGDSLNIKQIFGDIKADLLFSCPPYADLEVYSDDKKDLSNMPYKGFISNYRSIIADSFDLLKENSFAFWVVGEVRDKKGNYYNFVGDTISAFMDAGFKYYNEAVIVTQVGTVAMTVNKSMTASRKLGKTHQNVLIFVKGDGKKAAQNCGDIEINIDVDE